MFACLSYGCMSVNSISKMTYLNFIEFLYKLTVVMGQYSSEDIRVSCILLILWMMYCYGSDQFK